MISYAYRTYDRDEENIAYAINCTPSDQGIRFFCPNPDCDAHMYLCNLNNPDIKPYFRATLKAHPHKNDCTYAKLSFDIEDYNEIEFDFERITKNVMKPSRTGQTQVEKQPSKKSGKHLPPHTIKQIYELAISNSIDFSYNGIKMWQLLADRRSAHIYRKGIFRNCLVESIFAGYKTEKKYIRMKYFTDQANFHYLKLFFVDDEVMSKTLKVILEAKPKPVIIWGDWKPVDYYYKTIIFSLNQLYVP